MSFLIRFQVTILTLTIAALALPESSYGQRGRPPARKHTANQRQEIKLVTANQTLREKNTVTSKKIASVRVMEANSIPEHKVGRFPNRGNPHQIRQVKSVYRVARSPKANRRPTPVGMNLFGVALNGIVFDPGAAEFWKGNRSSSWQYEALGGAIPLGLDENFGHVQPDGKYHYHGIPTGLLKTLGEEKDKHSPLVGWAADGFPIYRAFGLEDPKDIKSKIVLLHSSYQLKKGRRPGGERGDELRPGGTYDGTFVADYEYVLNSGDLDECNGRFTVTPEFPEGTYAYFLTDEWPVVPRFYRGSPNASFTKGRPKGPQSRGSGRRKGGKKEPNLISRHGKRQPDSISLASQNGWVESDVEIMTTEDFIEIKVHASENSSADKSRQKVIDWFERGWLDESAGARRLR